MQIVTTTRKGQFGFAVECGQSIWRRRSWRRLPGSDNLLRYRRMNKTINGFAFGPLMFWKN